MKLSINIMTRGRPDTCRETLKHTLLNMGSPDTTLLLTVDDDDRPTLDALKTFPEDNRLWISVKPREDSRGEKYDRVLTEAPADIYMLHVDTAPILTPGFDIAVTKAAAEYFPDGIGCIYSPMANRSFPGIQCPTAKLVEKIGWTYSHDYPFWFIDHELDDICRMIGRYAFVDVRVDHNTLRASKTHRMRDLTFWCTYYDIMRFWRRGEAHKIIDSEDFDARPHEKVRLKTQYPIVEERSLMINDGVRAQAMAIEAARGDGTKPYDEKEHAKWAERGDEIGYFRSLYEGRSPPDPGYVRMHTKARQKFAAMQQLIMQQSLTREAA